ncbi:hypothetical protein [uncultured Ligilactobacillus sp.]|uniref:hypothetical protein n=1 Tax=uncultured Ligilactobacillus sp. TaxID=2837633 RepID=UPI00272C6065|nr:hypothetical protein [uncultured Ligilactobacillus sp.]
MAITFMLLALLFSWPLINDLPKYLFFISFNFIIALSSEILVVRTYRVDSRACDLTKGILALSQLTFASTFFIFC